MEKKTNYNIVIIVVIMIMVLGLGGYIVYDKVINNKTSDSIKETDDDEKPNDIVVTQKDIDKLMERINYIPNFEELTIDELKSFTNQQKLLIAFRISEESTGKDFKAALVEYFGSDLDVKLEDLKCTINHEEGDPVFYSYDEKTDIFKYNENHPPHGGGFISSTDSYNYFVSYNVSGNTITIEVKKIFSNDAGDDVTSENYEYYKTYKDFVNGKNKVDATKNSNYCPKDDEGHYECNWDSIYNGEKNNLETYSYVFEKQNDNYIFKNYSIKK